LQSWSAGGLLAANWHVTGYLPCAVQLPSPAQVEDFASWLTGKQEEQGKLAAHEDPAFKTQEVTSWLGRVQKVRQ
jgi:hypothetical protein